MLHHDRYNLEMDSFSQADAEGHHTIVDTKYSHQLTLLVSHHVQYDARVFFVLFLFSSSESEE